MSAKRIVKILLAMICATLLAAVVVYLKESRYHRPSQSIFDVLDDHAERQDTLRLGRISVKLGNDNRYLKAELYLDYPRGKKQLDSEIENKWDQLGEAAAKVIASHYGEDLQSVSVKSVIVTEVTNSINAMLRRGRVNKARFLGCG